MNTINTATIALIKHFESLHDGDLTLIGLQPKRCPAGIWTVGWGHAVRDPKTGEFLRREVDRYAAYRQYSKLTEAGAEALLANDLKSFAAQVANLCTVPTTDNEFGAMTSLAYNIGGGNFAASTVLKAFLAGDKKAAGEAFLMWNKAKGKNGKKEVLRGLTVRREAEKELFLTS